MADSHIIEKVLTGLIKPVLEKPSYALHDACGFRTDYQFITKSKMKTIQKKNKGQEEITIVRDNKKTAIPR